MTLRGPARDKIGVQKRAGLRPLHRRGRQGRWRHGHAVPDDRVGDLKIRTYNMMGEQFAFHRGDKSEEVHVQFRGDAIDMCEFGTFEKVPGEVTVMPRGVAHSVISDPPENYSFLRLNFYSSKPWRVPCDPTAHKYPTAPSTLKTTIHKDSDWRLASSDWRAAALR